MTQINRFSTRIVFFSFSVKLKGQFFSHEIKCKKLPTGMLNSLSKAKQCHTWHLKEQLRKVNTVYFTEKSFSSLFQTFNFLLLQSV